MPGFDLTAINKGSLRACRRDAGFASSSGLILISTGPYEADPLRQAYGSVAYTRGSASFGAYFTAHEALYVGLLPPSVSDIASQSLTLDAKYSRTLAGKHLLVYGGSLKRVHFDLNFVPDQHRRQELGAFVSDDIYLVDRLRLSLGARLDWFDTFGAFVSPRAGVRFDPVEGHTLRAGYNRAYVAPSLVESFSYFPTSLQGREFRLHRAWRVRGSPAELRRDLRPRRHLHAGPAGQPAVRAADRRPDRQRQRRRTERRRAAVV